MNDINYRVHEKLSDVADLKVREAMDSIVAIVKIEVAEAHGEAEKRGEDMKCPICNSGMYQDANMLFRCKSSTCSFRATGRHLRSIEQARASEAAKYKAVVEAAKAFTSGGQAELCGACAYGRFNARKLSSALAALEGK